MVPNRQSLDFFEDHEELAGDVVKRVEDRIHEILRRFILKIEQASSDLEQEELRVGRVFHTLVYVLLESFAFREAQ